MDNSFFLLSVKEGIQKIKAGEITALDWMSSCASRIERIDENIHAWAYFNKDLALANATVVDQKTKPSENFKASGSLAGVPVGIKDIFNTADMPTCMGSPIWEGFTPGNDARTVSNLKQADAIIAGKTVTAEFAVHTPGKTVNPHHSDYSPGTSSSGSAAAVASFMVPVALGTQTAGSIMRPASYCGVYGFKPSFGLIPRTGTLKTTDSLDTIGLFARSADDLELVFETIRVRGEDYPMVHALVDAPPVKPKDKWKIGVVSSSLWVWEKAASYARNKLNEFANSLSQDRIEVEDLKLPPNFNKAHEIHSTIYDKTLSYYFKEEFKQHTLVSEVMYNIISHGQKISLDQYKEALDAQNKLSRLFDSILEKYDAIVTLTTAGQAPKWGKDDIPDSCLIWTLCGAPVINLPAFKSPDGLPFGAQIVSRRYRDKNLLNLARHLETLYPDQLSVNCADQAPSTR